MFRIENKVCTIPRLYTGTFERLPLTYCLYKKKMNCGAIILTFRYLKNNEIETRHWGSL